MGVPGEVVPQEGEGLFAPDQQQPDVAGREGDDIGDVNGSGGQDVAGGGVPR